MRIYDATGSGRGAEVDKFFRLKTNNISNEAITISALQGQGFTVSTGTIALTSGKSAVLYGTTTGDLSYIVHEIYYSLGDASSSGDVECEIIRNPTTGTIIDNALDFSYGGNMNFGATADYLGTGYKGAQGYTLTDGTPFRLDVSQDGGVFEIDPHIIMPRGSSIGINITVPSAMDVCVTVLFGIDESGTTG